LGAVLSCDATLLLIGFWIIHSQTKDSETNRLLAKMSSEQDSDAGDITNTILKSIEASLEDIKDSLGNKDDEDED